MKGSQLVSFSVPRFVPPPLPFGLLADVVAMQSLCSKICQKQILNPFSVLPTSIDEKSQDILANVLALL